VDIPRTGARGSDVSFEALLQEYLRFPYDYFLLVLSFKGYCCKLCPSKNPGKNPRINIGWTCWPNTTADYSVSTDIGQSLHRHACNVGSSWVLLKQAIESSSVNSGKNCPRMTCTYLSQLIVSLKYTGPTILLVPSLNVAGFRWLHVDSVNSSSDYFAYLCKVKPRFIRKEFQLRIDLTFDDRL
jgi:hypothetical protein